MSIDKFTLMKSLTKSIALDIETTGLTPDDNSVVEIGCVIMKDGAVTNEIYHTYLKPHNKMSEQAQKVNGLSDEFLSTKPLFSNIVDDFLRFIKNEILIIHNAKFDISFLNMELQRIGKQQLTNIVIDSLEIAKSKYPHSSVSLDALTSRFNVPVFDRHGALGDATILAKTYIPMVAPKSQDLFEKLQEEDCVEYNKRKLL